MNIKKDWERLRAAHIDEADRKQAAFFNLGWATGDNFIHSKTDKGKLYSEIGVDGLITHAWGEAETYEDRKIQQGELEFRLRATCDGCGEPLKTTESIVPAANRHASCI